VARTFETSALLVRSIAQGESDLLVTFLTREAGIVSARVRGARASVKRFGGALEPLHEILVTLEDKGREFCQLKEARLSRLRTGLVTNLEAMDAAGCALRWTRRLCPPKTKELGVWAALEDLLEALNRAASSGIGDPGNTGLVMAVHLVVFGLRLLSTLGYGLELDACVQCGRPCPEGRTAFVDAQKGGVVCTGCGGASRVLTGQARQMAKLAQQAALPSIPMVDESDLRSLRGLIDEAMAVHAGPEGRAVGPR
jgi:DNA repair protein RecO (recombination protein O)